MKMSVYVNLARIALYLLLAGVSYHGELPWYVPLGLFLYDINATVLVPLPFTGKWAARRMSETYQHQIQELLDQQQAAIPGPSDPKKWS